MSEVQKRIETLSNVADTWLSDDNEHLLRAVHNTVEENYFSFEDVQFALKSLRNTFTQDAMEQWVKQAGVSEDDGVESKNILCLHAGNLPLVGFQDVLAVLLSGAKYTGKISRKDPYLLPTFLNEVKKTEVWSAVDVQWSHRLDDFEDMRGDKVLFAGSERSVPGVKEAIRNLNMETSETKYLIRTAHFSLAYLDQDEEEHFHKLAEAILRYGGQGCRSVAVIVSPFAFESIAGKLRTACEQFLSENPQHKQPEANLNQRYAYNTAIERSQFFLNNFLVQEAGLELDQDFICYWIQGDEQMAADLTTQFSGNLQSVYTIDGTQLAGFDKPTEPLSDAQQPPIFWQPDGTDTLKWLCR